MSIVGFFKGTGPDGFGYDSTAEDVTEGLDLSDRTILITGFNSGIGNETARVLSMRGATVLGVARSQKKAETTCSELPGDAEPFVCDLSEPQQVESCVEDVKKRGGPIDAIIANAGIMALPDLNQKYGYELQFLTNHVGHFMLVTGLVDELADDGRAVVLSSAAHQQAPSEGIQFGNLSGEKGYNAWTAYGQSKLANLLFAKELARRFSENDEHNRVATALHPGVINTNLTRHMNPMVEVAMKIGGPLFLKSIPQGAATQTWAAVRADADTIHGGYLADCNLKEASDKAKDRQLAEKLWTETEEIVEELT
jgi:WW domain-containing oxidoreductase